jgi:phosphatidylserine/phosphatidylglycerophosphate/cardiolipin synthase-like enzyme
VPSYDPRSQQPLLRAGLTCWRVENASRVSVLVDGAAYFHAMKAAMEKAQRSILLLGWDFDPLVCPEPDCADGSAEPLFRLMERLIERNASLQIHILIWDMNWIFAVQRRDAPQHARKWLSNDRLAYRLDNQHPTGAAHHQKVLVVDDTIAFCGGSDFTRNRWDTPEHLPVDRRRHTRDGRLYGPRHDVVMAVEGAAAAALGDLFRERWRRAGGLALLPPSTRPEAWPDDLAPDATTIPVGLVRTEPGWSGRPEVREAEALNLHAIAAARRWIYIENQYFTSPVIGAALARRLAEPGGPEIVVVCPLHSGGSFDRLSMDHARNDLIHRLQLADRNGRFQAFAPLAQDDVPITVHSKLMIIDDRLLRVGSSNLNNRSLGFDTECDLAIEAHTISDSTQQALFRLLVRLVAEHTGSSAELMHHRIVEADSLLAGIGALNPETGRRLCKFSTVRLSLLDRLMASTHLFDPLGASDNWRPWRRIGLAPTASGR